MEPMDTNSMEPSGETPPAPTSSPPAQTLKVVLRLSIEKLKNMKRNEGSPAPVKQHKGGWPKGVKRFKDPNGPPNSSGIKATAPKDSTGLPIPSKLGPKANMGAINAGLRALERNGRKCRRWERKPLELRSFTGVPWAVQLWVGKEELPENPSITT